MELFEAGLYDAARDKYIIARQCPEYATVQNSIDKYIASCDTMVMYSEMLDSYEENGDYDDAIDLIRKMIFFNPRCTSLLDRYSTLSNEYSRLAAYDMTLGEQYMLDKKYDLARERYEHAVKMRCSRSDEAALQLEQISLINYKKDNHTRNLFYQYNSNMPISFMSASLNPDKAGGGYYLNETSGDDTGSSYHWFNAVTPEVGLAVRVWRISLNYKFQYRYLIEKGSDAEQIMGGTRHSFGIGFCW